MSQKLEEMSHRSEGGHSRRQDSDRSSRKGPSSREREKELAQLREEEEKRREEEQRQAQTEKERKEREESARIEREQMAEETRRKEEEDKRLEIERRAQEERERLAHDAEEQERQRKKQALLAKLSAMDDAQENGKTASALTMSPTRAKKDWKFTDPVENMYQGKPAYDITSSPKRKSKVAENDDDFGYTPSFGGKWNSGPKTTNKGRSLFGNEPVSSTNNNNKEKKADFMASLFGNDAARKPTPPSMEREGSGLDFTTNSNSAAARRKSSTKAYQQKDSLSQQYGAGLGVVSDSPPPSTNNRLLPKRINQASSGFSRSAVNGFDDDIEEMVL